MAVGLIKIIFLFAGVLPVYGDVERVLTLEQAVTMGKDNSPEIQQIRNQFLSAQAKQAQALAPYEPTLSILSNDTMKPWSFGDSGASTTYQVQQQIGFPGRALLSRAMFKHQALALEAQLRAIELQVVANIKSAYYQVIVAQENLSLNEEQRGSYERILEIAKRRYASGAIPQVDLLNAQVTLYANSNDLNDLRATERSSRAQLNILLGQDMEQELKVEKFKAAEFPLPTLEDAKQKMSERRSEIRVAKNQLEAAEYSYSLSKMSLLPDFFVTAGSTHYHAMGASPWSTEYPDTRQQTYMLGLQITVPIWGLFNERQVIIGAAKDRAAAQANLQVTLNQSLIQLRSNLENLQALKLRLENYEKHLLPLSEQALSLALISYSAGKIDFQTLVDTANSRRNTRRDYLTAVTNYRNNYAILGQLLGEEL